jgi:pimeloyl-ACP methyl ester carboxylesterase
MLRAHRTFRTFADRLARAGLAVLRFDYYGSGESMGDDAEIDLSGWVDDILSADATLLSRAGVTRSVWVGLRLGATLALQAARRAAPASLDRLILWDPMFDGNRYLEDLRSSHVASLQEARSYYCGPAPVEIARRPDTYRDEACGFPLSHSLRRELAALQVENLSGAKVPCDIVLAFDSNTSLGQTAQRWSAARGGSTLHLPISHDIEWMAESMESGGMVPGQALHALERVVYPT